MKKAIRLLSVSLMLCVAGFAQSRGDGCGRGFHGEHIPAHGPAPARVQPPEGRHAGGWDMIPAAMIPTITSIVPGNMDASMGASVAACLPACRR
jgi:hypothetical protein